VEYFIKEQFAGKSFESLGEFVHFACTSEDINNMSHALMLRDGLVELRKVQEQMTAMLTEFALKTKDSAMLAHTHGQPASPTTLGKEMAVFVHRLRRQATQIDAIVMPAKLNGAVGNFNAHLSAYPDVDWQSLTKKIIEETFGLKQTPLTTQIESHDGMGVGFGYSLTAYQASIKGIGKIKLNAQRLADDLDNAWEVLAEPVQTVMRKLGLPNPYEQLKELTRGRKINAEIMKEFIDSLDIPEEDKLRLREMTPSTYIGIAPELAELIQ
jgi:adenylosuccinate lyase